MAQDFDPHILATMTDEERASILEEQSPEEKAAIVAIDTGSENGPDDDDEDDEDDEGAAPALDKAQAPAEVVAVVPTVKEADRLPELPEKAFQPHYQATLPDDFDAQEAAIKSQADHFHGDHLFLLLLKNAAGQWNTLVSFKSALARLDGQLSVGVNRQWASFKAVRVHETDRFRRIISTFRAWPIG